MSKISDYVIWVGEKIQAQIPSMSWNAIVDVVITGNFDQERYSIENYLNETYVRKEVNNGKSQHKSGETGGNANVSRESQMAGEGESHAGQASICDMADSTRAAEQAKWNLQNRIYPPY